MGKKNDIISVKVPSSLSKQINKEISRAKKSGRKLNESDMIVETIRRHFLGKHGSAATLWHAYREIQEETIALKHHGEKCLKQNKLHTARKHFLLAASKNLEALSILDDPSDETLTSFLIEVVQLLKRGTGYKHLPDVPHQNLGLSMPKTHTNVKN